MSFSNPVDVGDAEDVIEEVLLWVLVLVCVGVKNVCDEELADED